MKFFIDTANIEEIKEAAALGILMALLQIHPCFKRRQRF